MVSAHLYKAQCKFLGCQYNLNGQLTVDILQQGQLTLNQRVHRKGVYRKGVYIKGVYIEEVNTNMKGTYRYSVTRFSAFSLLQQHTSFFHFNLKTRWVCTRRKAESRNSRDTVPLERKF